MSAFSHTDWTVTCNGIHESGVPCLAQGRTDLITGATTAADVRRHLKKLGWAVNVPSQEGLTPGQWFSRARRLDFCPEHRTDRNREAAVKAGEDEE